MGPDAWLTLATVVLILGALVFMRIGPDIVFTGGLTLLLLTGLLAIAIVPLVWQP